MQTPLDLEPIKAHIAIMHAIPLGPEDNPGPADILTLDADALLREVERLQGVEGGLTRQVSDLDALLGKYMRAGKELEAKVKALRDALAPIVAELETNLPYQEDAPDTAKFFVVTGGGTHIECSMKVGDVRRARALLGKE